MILSDLSEPPSDLLHESQGPLTISHEEGEVNVKAQEADIEISEGDNKGVAYSGSKDDEEQVADSFEEDITLDMRYRFERHGGSSQWRGLSGKHIVMLRAESKD